MILAEKQQKYQLYHLKKMINMNILQVKQKVLSNQRQIIEQAKFTYSPLGKAFEKQTQTIEEHGEKEIKGIKIKEKKNKGNQKQSQKKGFRHRSKVNCFFIFKIFSK